ncbi:MAG TPA: phosphotransferase [Nocardioides sp.]
MNSELRHFIKNARWFASKGRTFQVTGLRRAGTLPLPDEGPGVAIDLVEITFAEGDSELYQLPLAFRTGPDERLDHALIGVWDDPDFGRSHVYDAIHDREAMSQVLASFADPSLSPGALAFHRLPGRQLDTSAVSSPFTGEQSNSSVAFGEDSLLKLFRKVTPGVNPDVQVHRVLTEAGSDHVAALLGWLEVDDPHSEGTGSVIQLGMLQQFLRTASDGWELAQASVRNLYAEADLHAAEVGGDFAGESERLGDALAEIHDVLAEKFPVATRSPDEMAELARTMRARLDAAIEVVPDLAEHRAALGAIFDQVAGFDEVAVQRIHGDLHLGQTLRTAKGWKIVDFEGEPAKPLAERVLPDSRWRDVAGMLRSFDYAALAVARIFAGSDGTGESQRDYRGQEWTQRNRSAFLRACAGRELSDDEQLLLDAYEADKAVYECVYEVRNRPSWLPIPLAGIERIVNR